MQLGLFIPLISPTADPEFVHTLGTVSEACGFDSLWLAEHVVLFDDYESRYPYAEDGKIPAGGESGLLELFTTAAYLAACTSTIRLGTGICLVPQRNPVYTAKEVTTVDWLSNGRLDFGIGIGWLAEEFGAVNVPFARRNARCRSYMQVMHTLWTDAVSQHEDEFYSLPPCRQYPKPVQQPHPPIHVGGEGDPALRRVADLAQGWYPYDLTPDELAERMPRLESILAERGRKRADIQVSICPYTKPVDADALARYRDAGADQVILFAFPMQLDRLRGTIEDLAESLLEPARAL